VVETKYNLESTFGISDESTERVWDDVTKLFIVSKSPRDFISMVRTKYVKHDENETFVAGIVTGIISQGMKTQMEQRGEYDPTEAGDHNGKE
jgi:hypothetical protein